MYISRIELTKFKSYKHAELTFPPPSDGRNIVLIGGMNGYGKTTILEALYLCLYGKDSLPHLARAGLKIDDVRGYPTFLEKALNGETRREQADDSVMSVRVVLNRTKTKGLDIIRRWFFKSNGKWIEEECIVRELIRDNPGLPRKDGERSFSLSEVLEQQYIPAHIAPFFFFDGEEVKKLADQSKVEQVKQGLEGLLGVVLLRNLSDRLKTFEDNKRAKLSNVDLQNIDSLAKRLVEEESRQEKARSDLEDSESHTNLLKAERQSLLDRIVSSGGGGGDVASVKDLVEEREQLRTQLKKIEATLASILADKLPFYLAPKSLIGRFRTQIDSELTLTKWQTECRALQPKQDNFYRQLLEADTFPFTPDLTTAQAATLKSRVEAAWESLFLPPPPNSADTVVHDYLHDELKKRAARFLDSLDVGRSEINALVIDRNSLIERIAEITRRISRLEGIDHDGTLASLKDSLNTVIKKIDEREALNGNLQREIDTLGRSIHQTRATLESEKKRHDSSSPDRALIERSERVRRVIEKVVPSLFPLKVRQLSQAMTRVYKQLAHKNHVNKILIENDGTTRIVSANGKELDFDRSAGENQIFATALIAGLAEVSKIDAPLLVDTPLGRLDSEHRKNIFDFWISDQNRQVILLSQDEEISKEQYHTIRKHVSRTFLLNHVEVGDGIGRTTVSADNYFDEGRQ